MAMAASTLIVLRLIDAVPLHGFLKQAVNLGVPSLAGGAVLLWALLMLGVVKGASLYSLPGIGRLLVRT